MFQKVLEVRVKGLMKQRSVMAGLRVDETEKRDGRAKGFVVLG